MLSGDAPDVLWYILYLYLYLYFGLVFAQLRARAPMLHVSRDSPQRPGPDNERAAIEFEIAALAECAHPHVVRLYGTSNVGKVRL